MHDISKKTPLTACQSDTDHHCMTCADEAVQVKVIRLSDQEMGLALVEMSDQTDAQSMGQEEIDITLVEDVQVGDVLLAHGGVAIAHLASTRMEGKERIV